MRKRIYLHIGAHKTGTTAVQLALSRNRERLAALGYLYPMSCLYAQAQHRLAFALKGARDPGRGDRPAVASEIGELMREIDASPLANVIVSSEEFFATSSDNLALLAAALAGHEVTVVAVVRRPDELFASIYNQRMKSVTSRARESYLRLLDRPTELHEDLHFERCLARWAAAFGRPALRVVAYEDEPDAVRHFCHQVGIAADGLEPDPSRSNPSQNAKTIELIRLARVEGIAPDVIREMSRIAEACFENDHAPSSLLTPDERMTILRRMDAITNATFHEYVGRENIYRSDRFSPADFPAQTRLTTRELVKVLAFALQRGGEAGR